MFDFLKAYFKVFEKKESNSCLFVRFRVLVGFGSATHLKWMEFLKPCYWLIAAFVNSLLTQVFRIQGSSGSGFVILIQGLKKEVKRLIRSKEFLFLKHWLLSTGKSYIEVKNNFRLISGIVESGVNEMDPKR